MKVRIICFILIAALPLLFGCSGEEKSQTAEEPVITQGSVTEIPENKYFIERENIYAGAGYEPELELNADGTFMFLVNLFEGMGNVYGTYELDGDIYTFYVSERNFGGFAGDDVDKFEMMISGDTLIYLNDDMIGVTDAGSVFYPAE